MKRLTLTLGQMKRASTKLALATSEEAAVVALLTAQLYREAVVHLYFASFYASQALLVAHLPPNPTHKSVNTSMHQRYGRVKRFPRRYVQLHSRLLDLRHENDYRTTYAPDPDLLRQLHKRLKLYLALCFRLVPLVRITDLLKSLIEDHGKVVRDLSFDVYCPRTYAHHTRMTCWQPPFYLDIFGPERLAAESRVLLKSLKVRRSRDYVVGVNSRLDQYGEGQLVMLDFDSVDPALEAALAPIGGVLLKTGRGYHFIGAKLFKTRRAWENEMRRLRRHRALRKHVDTDHIDISLQRGYATLRVTASPAKPDIPFFYKEL